MSGLNGTRPVVTLDLSAVDLADLLSRRFHETLAQLLPTAAEASGIAPWRVVFIDRARDIAAHALVFEHALSARLDVRALCLVTGELGADGQLHRPDLLARHENAGTLWIGDADGVAWGMETSTAADVYSSPVTTAYAAPSALLEALQRPEVFDAVLTAVRALPSAAAGPGLRAVRAEVAPDRLERGVAAAVAHLTARDGTWTREPVPLDVGQPGEYAGGQAIIRPGGKIDTHYVDATGRLRAVRTVLDQGRGNLAAAAAELRSALVDLIGDAESVIEHADPRLGPAVYRVAFDQLGLETAAAARGNANPALDVLAAVGADFFAHRGPLLVLADRLRVVAGRFAKPPREIYEAELAATGIAGSRDRLGALGSDPDLLRSPTALASSFTAAAGTALLPGSAPAGVAVAAVFGVGVLVWQRARLARLGLAAVFRGQALRQGATTLAGAALGAAASWLAGWTLWSGPTRFAAGTAGAAVPAVLLAVVSRRLLTAELRRAVGVNRIGDAVEKVKGLIEKVARAGRWTAERRSEVYDFARVLAAIVDELEEALGALHPAATLVPGGGAAPEPAGIDAAATARLREQISEVDVVLLGDLSDVTAVVFERYAAKARTSHGIAMPIAGEVEREAAGRFAAYLGFAARVGVHRAPQECRDLAVREQLVAGLWGQAGHLPDLIWAEAADDRITQFCEPEDLDFLEVDPGVARLVRFAPRAAESLVGRAQRPDRPATAIEWTDDSRLLGVIRLVPLRAGVISDDVQPAYPGSVELGVPVWEPAGEPVLVPEDHSEPDFADDDDAEDLED